MHYSVTELWGAMGPLAKGVVILLSLMSLASLAMAVERIFAIREAAGRISSFEPEWQDILGSDLPPEDRREAFDRSVRRATLETGALLRRGLPIVATVGSTAPFVGLFGTVVGIVNAFQQLATADHAGVGTVSAGIAEALVTTAFGIGVAIPAVWLFNYLTQRIGQVVVAIECRAQGMAVNWLRRPR